MVIGAVPGPLTRCLASCSNQILQGLSFLGELQETKQAATWPCLTDWASWNIESTGSLEKALAAPHSCQVTEAKKPAEQTSGPTKRLTALGPAGLCDAEELLQSTEKIPTLCPVNRIYLPSRHYLKGHKNSVYGTILWTCLSLWYPGINRPV